MYRIAICITALSICHTSLRAQETAPVDPLAPGENICKHFTGNIGGRKAVLDLRYGFQTASSFGGSTYYFTDEGTLNYFLISKPNTTAHTETLRGQVFPENLPLSQIKDAYSIFVQTPRFELRVSHDSLIGQWFNPNGQQGIVTMTEDYSHALRFDFKYAADSAFATGKKDQKVRASVTYSGIDFTAGIKAADRSFILGALSQFLGGARSEAGTTLPQVCFEQFITDFKTYVKKNKELDGSDFSGIYTLFPVYNDNGFLVLQKGGYQYDFKNKEYTDRNTYLNLDLASKKNLRIEDILNPAPELLSTRLGEAFRKKYQLEPGKKLSALLTTDKMPLTDNFVLGTKGLIFSYSPVKICKEDTEISELQEMRIFLTWEELGDMLKPEFKKRMGVK